MKHRASLVFGMLALAATGLAGCLGDPGGDADPARVTSALDNQVDPDEGKTCYQDVPMRKGKMEMGMCCFDDPIKGTSYCVVCDKEHTCTVGGATPGALVADPGTWPTRATLQVTSSASQTFTLRR